MERSILKGLSIIPRYWNSLKGCFLTNLIVLSIYAYIFQPFDQYPLIHFTAAVLIVIVISFYWAFNTNRFYLRNNKEIVIALFLKIDDDKIESRVNKIIKNVVSQIHEDIPEISVRPLPINELTQQDKFQRYLKNRDNIIDVAIVANINSGNFELEDGRSEERIILTDVNFIGRFSEKHSLKIFQTQINIKKDLSLRESFKDWQYVESNSGIDKKKLKINLYDSILYFCGIHLLYLKKPDTALKILKKLHSNSEIFASNSKKLNAKKIQVLSNRLKDILQNLLYTVALRKYEVENDLNTAYEYLKECEHHLGPGSTKYDLYIALARCEYERGDIGQAKAYTHMAKQTEGMTIHVMLNLSFFAAVEKNINEFVKWQKRIAQYSNPKYNDNFIEIVTFLEKEKEQVDNAFIELSIASFTKYYIDVHEGNAKLDVFIEKYAEPEEYDDLTYLAIEFRKTKGKMRKKSVHPQRPKPNSARKKKKKKKRR